MAADGDEGGWVEIGDGDWGNWLLTEDGDRGKFLRHFQYSHDASLGMQTFRFFEIITKII